jgi:hypothetical protein
MRFAKFSHGDACYLTDMAHSSSECNRERPHPLSVVLCLSIRSMKPDTLITQEACRGRLPRLRGVKFDRVLSAYSTDDANSVRAHSKIFYSRVEGGARERVGTDAVRWSGHRAPINVGGEP